MCFEFFFSQASPQKADPSKEFPRASRLLQVELILFSIVLWIGIMCTHCCLKKCRKVSGFLQMNVRFFILRYLESGVNGVSCSGQWEGGCGP